MKSLLRCLLAAATFAMVATPASADDFPFGAYYTHLNSGESFESTSKTYEYADIVVKVDNQKQFIFWRASSYQPHLKVGTNLYYVETLVPRNGDHPAPRFDNINRYSWVKIVENTSSRVVVEWRYRPDFGNLDGDSGIVYETYTITPGGEVIRVVKRGAARLKDWQDPNNHITQTFTVSHSGITKVVTTKGYLSNHPYPAVIGASVKSTSVKAPVRWWRFDEGLGHSYDTTTESITSTACAVSGPKTLWRYSPVSGTALAFDGYNTKVALPSASTPVLGDKFAVEAWVAMAAYPYCWVPLVHQSTYGSAGFYLGVDDCGHLGWMVEVNGIWRQVISTNVIPIRTWTQVLGSYDKSANSMRLFINGVLSGSTTNGNSSWSQAASKDVILGLNDLTMKPAHPVRDWATFATVFGFDGLIDEVRIYDDAFSAAEALASYNGLKPAGAAADLEARHLPGNPQGQTAPFGAWYTNLQYYEAWDNLWCNTDSSDIIVRFDQLPVSYVFWKGMRYAPAMVTENGKYAGDQSCETSQNWGHYNAPPAPTGCCEHMSDRETRHAHVRLIESTPARAVVEWRYGETDVQYLFAHVKTNTGWGDWADEYWTIYPDGVAARYIRAGKGGWNEAMFINEDGTAPEDNVDLKACTLVSDDGTAQTLDWAEGFPRISISDPVIAMLNIKSTYRPCFIYPKNSRWEVFNGEMNPRSHFPAWDHWPVFQGQSDGNVASTFSRATSTSLLSPRSSERAILNCMTRDSATSLNNLQRSWNSAPAVANAVGCASQGYVKSQRAYQFAATASTMSFNIEAATASPINNLCFVIKHWGASASAGLQVNGAKWKPGTNFRQGKIIDTDGTCTMIIWVSLLSASAQSFEITKE